MSEPIAVESAAAMEDLGAQLAAQLTSGSIVILTGDLGAGKTQLAKGIARGLGINEPLTSPTFNLVQVYDTPSGAILQHFDLYRLESAEELDDIDYFGLIEDPRAISLVEWGDKFPDALPSRYLLVDIAILDANTRAVSTTLTIADPIL